MLRLPLQVRGVKQMVRHMKGFVTIISLSEGMNVMLLLRGMSIPSPQEELTDSQ
jgi:hypothetical protein